MLVLLAVALLVGSFALSALLTALAKRLAPRIGLVAHPKADRYHRSIIPLGGGIAIFFTLAIFLLGARGHGAIPRGPRASRAGWPSGPA